MEISTTRVVRIRRERGVVTTDCDVYIGRACFRGGWKLPQSKWHNPFPLSKFSMEESLQKFESHVRNNPKLMAALLPELEGKVLGCWCKKNPSDLCHGDVLVKLVQERIVRKNAKALKGSQRPKGSDSNNNNDKDDLKKKKKKKEIHKKKENKATQLSIIDNTTSEEEETDSDSKAPRKRRRPLTQRDPGRTAKRKGRKRFSSSDVGVGEDDDEDDSDYEFVPKSIIKRTKRRRSGM